MFERESQKKTIKVKLEKKVLKVVKKESKSYGVFNWEQLIPLCFNQNEENG